MADLPDLVLLRVFDSLDPAQLLRVRAVCRRWRDLMSEPAVWRHRTILINSGIKTHAREALASFKVAPCVESLVMYLWTNCPEEDALADSVVRSSCAAQSLTLHVGSFLAAWRILHRQVELGCLTQICISFIGSEWVQADANAFEDLLVTLNTSGVEQLDICKRFHESFSANRVQVGKAVDKADAAMSGTSFKAPMKTLRFSDGFVLDALPAFFMKVHADSLEDVVLMDVSLGKQPAFSGFPAMKRLRKLVSPLLEDMTVLLSSVRLQSLVLVVSKENLAHPGCLVSAGNFRRQATWLRALQLRLCIRDVVGSGVLDLLSAVIDSGSTALRYLLVEDISIGSEHVSVVRRVAAALPLLPSLRYLTISLNSFESFALLVSVVAEAHGDGLKLLTLRVFTQCLQRLIHSCVVRRALRNHSASLHLELSIVGGRRGLKCTCPPLAASCHPELRLLRRAPREVHLYAHPDSQPCRLGHSRRSLWLRLPPEETSLCPVEVKCPICSPAV